MHVHTLNIDLDLVGGLEPVIESRLGKLLHLNIAFLIMSISSTVTTNVIEVVSTSSLSKRHSVPSNWCVNSSVRLGPRNLDHTVLVSNSARRRTRS